MRRSMFRLAFAMQFLFLPALAAAVTFSFVVSTPVEAGPYKVLHSFCANSGCGDGSQPQGGLIIDGAGNLFGAAGQGGHEFQGTIFELVKTDTGKFKLSRLYSFCPKFDCLSGAHPSGALIMDAQGDLYGTASSGGTGHNGVVFELSPGGKNGWTYRVLYNFCQSSGCPDGAFPGGGLTYVGASSGVLYDGTSPLYGETGGGGANGSGTVYQLISSGGQWSETVLYSFCSQGGSACTDGAFPRGELLLDEDGALFGTADHGGGNDNGQGGAGVAYELIPNGDGTWTQSVLYRFCSAANCSDGEFPGGSLTMDGQGNLLGTTGAGGHPCGDRGTNGCGTIFRLVPNGAASQETVLYAFCLKRDCKDGAGPDGRPLLDSSGNIFGVTFEGGGNDTDQSGIGGGVVFELTGGELKVLHRFCSAANCADGEYPQAGLGMDASGVLFGATRFGGMFGGTQIGGTVFRLTP